jgi:hypothetical protein
MGQVTRIEGERGPVWRAEYRLLDGRPVERELGPAWPEGGDPPRGYFTKPTAEAWLEEALDAARRGEPSPPAMAGEQHHEDHDANADFYSPMEVKALARAAADKQDAAMLMTAAFTGLRREELIALRWRDVDFDHGVIRIAGRDVSDIPDSAPASEAGVIPMVDEVAGALAELGQRVDRGRAADDLVFSGSGDGDLDWPAFLRRYAAAQGRAGLRPVSFDQLRQTSTTGRRLPIRNGGGAQARGSTRLARPGETRSLSPSRTLPGERSPFRRTAAGSPDVLVSVLDGATLIPSGRGGFAIVDRDGRPVEGSAVAAFDSIQAGAGTHRATLSGTVCDLAVAGGYLYSHFLLDALPKYHALRLAGIQLAEIDTFLVNSVEAAYQRELLARAGVDLARVVPRDRLDSLDLLQVERLVWVTPVRSGFFTPSWAIEFLRGLVEWSPQPRASRRIYISRDDAPRRRVVNEAEVRTFVEARGFEVVSAASLTVAEMARLMAGAGCVVGAHGAGMVNVVFAPPPASVVELYGWHITAEYWLLCEQLGHRHHCLECAAPDGGREVAATKSKAVRNAADVIVDLDRLGRMLEPIL